MPAMVMLHEKDPRAVLLEKIGDVSDVEIFNNQVLVAVYQRPEQTKTGLFITDATRDEDKSQGKAGLVIKKGPDAFVSTEKWTFPTLNDADWVFFRASDGWAITINGVLCRIVDDVNVRGRMQHPDQVW